jgi:opacity protein-like surface antigen
MNRKIFSVSAGLACLAATALPALAGDWNNGAGTLKDRGNAAVPVPAPTPVPDGANSRGWYLRGTLGYSLKAGGDINSVGTDVGAYKSFGDVEGPIHGGFGYGAYVTKNWRWDVTGDFRPSQPVNAAKTTNYVARTQTDGGTVTVLGPGGATLTNPGYDINSFAMDRTEKIRNQDQTFLANFYYEPAFHSMFRPYLGAGAGFGVNTLSRSFKETGECTGTNTVYVDPFTGALASQKQPVCRTTPRTLSNGGSQTSYGVGLAGALMAGVGYEVHQGVIIDLGYRFLWQGQSLSATALAGAPGQSNRIDVGDRTDHEIRTTVRWSLN